MGGAPVSTRQHQFWGSPWAVAIIGGTAAAVIGGVILAAITSGQTASSSGPTSSPSSLKSQASTDATTPATTATGIYHQGTLALAYNGCADLDAPPGDPHWGSSQPVPALAAIFVRSIPILGESTTPLLSRSTRELTPPARMRRAGSRGTAIRISISASAVSFACTPSKVVTPCCVL
jgi:hypothetical protein